MFVVFLISAPLCQKLEPPANPVRFKAEIEPHGVDNDVSGEAEPTI